MRIRLNGVITEVAEGLTLEGLLRGLGLDGQAVAVELNLDIITRDRRAQSVLKENDEVEIVKFVGGGSQAQGDPFELGGKTFGSRLLIGTGRYPSFDDMRRCHQASGSQIVTLAVGRHPLDLRGGSGQILDFIDREAITLLPNTAGAYTVKEARRLASLARELLGTDWIKLEVMGDATTLWPDVAETVQACRELVRDGFKVFPYTTDDPIVASKLEDEGASAIMPLGSMIGSGLGLLNPLALQRIKATAKVPVIVDAGVGCASDAAQAMELGADAVLLNSAVAGAQDPVAMAAAMGLAIRAGRLSFLAGRIPKRGYATPSSPGAGLAGGAKL
ncbi:MAG: sulfur carrier protein ThiS [candidate division FCPU426 bacterium]